jgi:hypothetical protein
MIVRAATLADADNICTVLRASITELCAHDHNNDPERLATWLNNKTPDTIRGWITQPDFHTIVAEDSGDIIGVGGMFAAGLIALNYVAPHARFRGEHGLAACRLESTKTALRLYESLGKPSR